MPKTNPTKNRKLQLSGRKQTYKNLTILKPMAPKHNIHTYTHNDIEPISQLINNTQDHHKH